MDRELRVLIVEDSAADAELITKELGKGGLVHTSKMVKSKDEFLKALGEYIPDIILCDYAMPGFGAPEALEITQKSSPEIPFIVVSGAIGEDVAVEMMKSGAADYVMKGNISRLAPVVTRALKENEECVARKRAEEKLSYFRMAVDSATDAIGMSTPEGRHYYQNEVFTKLFGLSVSEVDGVSGPPASIYVDEKVGRKVFDTIMRGDSFTGEVKMLTIDKSEKDIFLRAYSIKDKEGKVIGLVGIHTDITERKESDERQKLLIELLSVLNRVDAEVDIVGIILAKIRDFTGFEAVGIRLEADGDYPYYVNNGFSEDFIKEENSLFGYDSESNILLDDKGKPYLECMCGNILSGRTDPTKPFFTEGGSFWTNCTTELLASTTEADRMTRTRNRCNAVGYESVGIIPIRSDSHIIGVLHFTDKRKDMFTPSFIKFFEQVGVGIGVAFLRKKMEDRIKLTADEWQKTFDSISDIIFILDKDHAVLRVNKVFLDVFSLKPEQVIGKKCYELVHKSDKPWALCPHVKTMQDNKTYTEEVIDPVLGIPLLVSTFPIFNDKGECIGSVHIAKDITERKKMEEVAGKRLHELEVFYKAAVGREERILELKKEVESLKKELGK